MIGKYQIEFNEKNFAAGESSSLYASDGGLALGSSNYNPILTPGILYGTAAENTSNNAFHGNVIASCEDIYTVPYNRIMVDDAGYFYYLSGSVVTAITNMATPPTLNAGACDLAAFNSGNFNYFFTYAGDIAKLTYNHSSPTFVKSWWQGTKSQSALGTGGGQINCMTVYQNLLYIADGNKLHNVDNSENIDTSVSLFSFNTNEIITALGVDPQTGLMMIGTVSGANASDSVGSKFWISLWDGVSATVTRRIPVDDMITAFKLMGGRVYVAQGTSIGFWNGNGVTYLKKMTKVTYNFASLIYKHHIDAWGGTLFVIDGAYIRAFGSIKQGSNPVWWTPYQQAAAFPLTCLAHVGQGVLMKAYNVTSGSAFIIGLTDLQSVTGASGAIVFAPVNFPRPVMVRRVRVVTTGVPSPQLSGSVSIQDESGNQTQPTVSQFSATTLTGTVFRFDFDFTSTKVATMLLLMGTGAANGSSPGWGLVRVIVYYDVAE